MSSRYPLDPHHRFRLPQPARPIHPFIHPAILEYYNLRSRDMIRPRRYEDWAVEALEDEKHWDRVGALEIRVVFGEVVWSGGKVEKWGGEAVRRRGMVRGVGE